MYKAILISATALVILGTAPFGPVAFGQSVMDASEIRSLLVTRQIGHERFMPYIEAARPDLVQIGNYGAMFHGYANDPKSTGWPMNLPMPGERQVLAFQRDLTKTVQNLGIKVIGYFRFINVLGDWESRSGFVDYYDNHWSEALLGPKPHENVLELLQRDSDGKPLKYERYPGHFYLHLCPTSPYARQALKQMLTLAIDHGVDGVITTYNYHFECVCEYCQDSFRNWLAERLSADELRDRLGIYSLENHTFKRIPARITGYPDPDNATDLDWLAMHWGAENFKRMFDKIFIEHGRSVKPDLIVATWNHLGNVGITEERAFLPIDCWGQNEDYFWYSGGASFVNHAQDLAAGKAGDAWLAHLYIRALGEGKPFVMGKYERVRLAMSMSEGYATGGLGMGRYMNFRDPAGFDVLTRYTQFRHANDALFVDAEPDADMALMLPRQAVQQRRPDALDAFRDMGQALVERSVILDVLVDQRLTGAMLDRYPTIVLPGAMALSDEQRKMLTDYVDGGGQLISWGKPEILDPAGNPRPPEESSITGILPVEGDDALTAAEEILTHLKKQGASQIDAPWTVRITAYRQTDRYLLHIVNYDREPGAREDNRGGPADERPEPVHDIRADLSLPQDLSHPSQVTLHAPDLDEIHKLDFAVENGRIHFVIPRILVYAIVAME